MYGKSFSCTSKVKTLENLIRRFSYFVLTPCKQYLNYILIISFYKHLNFKLATESFCSPKYNQFLILIPITYKS